MTLSDFPAMVDTLWLDGRLTTLAGQTPYGIIEKGAMAVVEGRIVWLGAMETLPADAQAKARSVHRLENARITFASLLIASFTAIISVQSLSKWPATGGQNESFGQALDSPGSIRQYGLYDPGTMGPHH